MLVAVGTVILPGGHAWQAAKGFALQVVAIWAAVFVVSRGEWTWSRTRRALLAPPNVAILAFLAWIGVSAAGSDLPDFSRAEAMRYLGGALIYFCVAYGAPRRNLSLYVSVLAVAVALAVVVGLLRLQGSPVERLSGAFRNEQLLAGVLCITMPVLLTASHSEEAPRRRMLALGALATVVVGLLATRNRSAWIGSAAGLILTGILYAVHVWAPRRARLQKHQIVIPLLALAAAAALFLSTSRMGDVLSQRAHTIPALGGDANYTWRLGMWEKALRMSRDRPLFGWGVGTFPVNQALYYHPACPNADQVQILQSGHTLRENAHNTYLQIAAELGLPGLALYLAVFAAFLWTSFRALGRMSPGFRQSVLIGCVAGVGAQMLCAAGSPAWEFPECSLFLWTVLGLGMGAAGLDERGAVGGPRTPLQRVCPIRLVISRQQAAGSCGE